MGALRLGGGLAVGAVLGAVLSWYVHPLGFMSDEIIREREAALALLLAHAAAVPAGVLVRRRFAPLRDIIERGS